MIYASTPRAEICRHYFYGLLTSLRQGWLGTLDILPWRAIFSNIDKNRGRLMRLMILRYEVIKILKLAYDLHAFSPKIPCKSTGHARLHLHTGWGVTWYLSFSILKRPLSFRGLMKSSEAAHNFPVYFHSKPVWTAIAGILALFEKQSEKQLRRAGHAYARTRYAWFADSGVIFWQRIMLLLIMIIETMIIKR